MKWIAIIAMTFDHIAYHLLPEGIIYDIFRDIGRVAYPLFAFMIAEGFRHTHNVWRYLGRLFFAALISEAVIFIVFLTTGDASNFLSTNVFIPLVMGLVTIIFIFHKKWFVKMLILPVLVLSYILPLQYGLYGVLMILIFGVLPNRWLQLTAFVIMSLFFIEWPMLSLLDWDARYLGISQWFSLLAFIPIFLYNGRLGKYNKWFFYIYYPFHIAIIFIIKTNILSQFISLK
ncbi:MAG: TraX family protein [Candidatus Izemoplasmatales bacterium]|nr:TraX family protein [Candidatus Izemoplasmatales bacterium]MDD3865188.1 TraX family protein [Candidatus Izemoplasmatales bacterium]